MREDYMESLKEKNYQSLAVARDRRFVIDFVSNPTPVPRQLGRQVGSSCYSPCLEYISWDVQLTRAGVSRRRFAPHQQVYRLATVL